jgi:hypothetical protein
MQDLGKILRFASLDKAQALIIKSVKWWDKTHRGQADRPTPNCQTLNQHNCHRHQESIRDVQGKDGAKWHKS